MILSSNNVVSILHVGNTCNTSMKKVCKFHEGQPNCIKQKDNPQTTRTPSSPATAGNQYETIISSTSNTTFSSPSDSTSRSKGHATSDTMTIPSAEKWPRGQNGSSFPTITSTVFTGTTAPKNANASGRSEEVGTYY